MPHNPLGAIPIGPLGEYIREQRRSAQYSVRQLAQAAGVSNPYLSQIERGLRKPSAEILQQLARALRISAETLYVRAGLLEGGAGVEEDAATDGHDVRSAVAGDPWLSARQKRALLDIYEAFRVESARDAAAMAGPAAQDDESTETSHDPAVAGHTEQ